MIRQPGNRGNAAVELVVLTPAVCLCAVFVFWCGRLGQARSQVALAADSGARAASMVRRSRMVDVGRSVAIGALRGNGVVCASSTAAVEVTDDRVIVTVRCTTDSRGVNPFTARTVTATAESPIDRYRAD